MEIINKNLIKKSGKKNRKFGTLMLLSILVNSHLSEGMEHEPLNKEDEAFKELWNGLNTNILNCYKEMFVLFKHIFGIQNLDELHLVKYWGKYYHEYLEKNKKVPPYEESAQEMLKYMTNFKVHPKHLKSDYDAVQVMSIIYNLYSKLLLMSGGIAKLFFYFDTTHHGQIVQCDNEKIDTRLLGTLTTEFVSQKELSGAFLRYSPGIAATAWIKALLWEISEKVKMEEMDKETLNTVQKVVDMFITEEQKLINVMHLSYSVLLEKYCDWHHLGEKMNLEAQARLHRVIKERHDILQREATNIKEKMGKIIK